MSLDNMPENKPTKIKAQERYKSRIVCTLCNKSISLKCFKYTHKCTHEDAPAREYDKEYFVTYYLEKDKADVSCFICGVGYQCYTSLCKHLNRNRDCKLKRLQYCNPDAPKTEIELLKKFGTRDVKNIIQCGTEEEREELLQPFYQTETVEELVTTPSPPPSPPYERVFVYSFHNDWGNRDIGFRNC
jgi:hypothetical protein